MSEYRRQIATGALVAVLLAGTLGFVTIFYLPTQPSYATTTQTTSFSSYTTATVTAGSTATTQSMTTITQASSTIPSATTYTNQTVTLDPRLAVSPLGNLSSNTNATSIAAALALNLGELPIRLISRQLPTCTGSSVACTQSTYLFGTAKGSNITMDFIGRSFYQLQYEVKNYSELYNDYWNTHPYGNPPTAAEDVAVGNLLLKTYDLDLSRVALNDNITGPGWASWSQEYNGLQIANSGQIYFEVYPPTSSIIRLLIVEGAGWSLIPHDFPLNISATAALGLARAYATNTIHMGFIGYASISFQIVQDHMYYAATVSDQYSTYILFVNPVTGEVGFPTA